MKKYRLKNTETKEIVKWTLNQILQEINRDRSDEWQDYDKNDWKEGLEVFTEWTLLK
jgi:AMMECR1 domain-containing protein